MLASLSGARSRFGCFLTAGLLFYSAVLQAQETRASIVGRVTDSSEALVVGVQVEATNLATNVSSATQTNAEGAYTIPFLLPGMYRVTAAHPGFRTFLRDNLELRIADRVQLNFVMELGETKETVTVSSTAPLLEKASASRGQVVDSYRITDLPLPSGQPYALIALSSGVAYTTSPNFDRPYEGNTIANYTMDGVQGGKSVVTLDGSPNTVSMHSFAPGTIAVGYTPPADVVQELKVQTLNIDASVGHTQGGVTNVSLKSGGNQLHGTGYWSGQNVALGANQFFNNKAGLPPLDFTYNRWGVSATGPVVIPKVYDGHNRTFFMAAYEGIKERRPRGGIYTVPTLPERQGDFSQLLRLGAQYQIYDPGTRVAAANGRYAVSPFSNNIVPVSRLNPVALNMLKYIPPPNNAGTADGTNNLNRSGMVEIVPYYNYLFRVDQNFSDRHRTFFRGNTFRRGSNRNAYFDSPDSLPYATGVREDWLSRALSFDDLYSISPTTILNVRVNFIRQTITTNPPPESIGFDLTSLGFPASYANAIDPSVRTFPAFTIAGYSGNNLNLVWFRVPNQTLSAEASVTAVRGNHELQFGGDWRLQRTFGYNYGAATSTGLFNFGTAWTQGPFDNSAASPIGQGLASMLLGLPTDGLVNRNSAWTEQDKIYSGYAQDQWRVTPKLTMTLGLRYELETPMTERYNRALAGFDFNSLNPLNAQVQANYAKNPIPEIPASSFKVVGGVTYPGVNGNSRNLWNTQLNRFMPRLGMAWQLPKDFVMRAGYAVFYGALGVERGDVNQLGFNQTTPLVPTLDNGLNFVGTLSNPFPNGIQNAPGSSLGLLTFVGKNVNFYNQDPRAPRQEKWYVGFQKVLPKNIFSEISYVGNHGSDLQIVQDYQSLPLQYLSTSATRDTATINSLTQNVPNPFYPLLPGTGLAGQTVTRAYLLQSGNYPQFTGLTRDDFGGYGWYHSVQTRLERRFAAGWTLQGTYTWAKWLEALSRLNGQYSPLEYVISAQDRRHRFSISGIWLLPFGSGQPLFGRAPRLVRGVISGWQFDGIYAYQSGAALTWPSDVFYTGNLNDIGISNRTPDQWFNVNGFNRVASQQPLYHLRTFPSRLPGVRAAPINNVDFSVIRNANIHENMTLQLRFEMLNALNHPQFGNPNLTPTSSAFGVVTTQVGYSRRVQFGLKLRF